MNAAQIIATQKRIGAVPDGFWGPKSIAACQRHLRALMPSPNPWPKSDQASLQKFYGSPGDESKHIALYLPSLGLKYEGRPVESIKCHRAVAMSLGRILNELSQSCPEVLATYAGVYNNRKMRGGSSPSLHARAAAIDLDPDRNGNSVSWPVRAMMPVIVMEAFACEGWLSAGAFWGRDAMHFQATQ